MANNVATKVNVSEVKASDFAYKAIADAIDFAAVSKELRPTAKQVDAMDAGKMIRASWAFGVDETSENLPFITFVREAQKLAKQASNDFVKMAMLRRAENILGRSFEGYIPSNRVLVEYTSIERSWIFVEVGKALDVDNFQLAKTLKLFGSSDESKKLCDEIIAKKVANKRQRKSSKVTTKQVEVTNSISDVRLTNAEKRQRLLDELALIGDDDDEIEVESEVEVTA